MPGGGGVVRRGEGGRVRQSKTRDMDMRERTVGRASERRTPRGGAGGTGGLIVGRCVGCPCAVSGCASGTGSMSAPVPAPVSGSGRTAARISAWPQVGVLAWVSVLALWVTWTWVLQFVLVCAPP